MKPADLSDPKVARVVEAGAALGIDVAPVTFENETRTAVDAATAVGCELGAIVKTLVFQGDDGPVLLLVSGSNRVDLERAAAEVGVTRLGKADANEARAASGFSIGATPPWGHASRLPIFMDEDLLRYPEVWAAGGRTDTVFPVTPQDLARATGAPVRRLS
jgi:prolyl-tRNA editing enzyme YbaK/EbsC (Cys-tRNA(Pro) deacylase)